MKGLLLTFLASCFLVGSCGKDNDDTQTDTQDRLIAQWKLIKLVDKDKFTGEEETQPFNEGSSIRFDANGICYALVDGENYSANWEYIDNKTGIRIDNSNGFDVNDSGYLFRTLTDHSMILLSKEDTAIVEQTIHFQK